MSGATAMTQFTPEADRRLAEYLGQVRAALAGVPDVSADDIEADVREHIETEFAAAIRAVTAVELEKVLVRLGPPEGWRPIAVGDAPRAAVEPFDWWWFARDLKRRVLGLFATLYRGPEDWRLAYITFILTVLAIPTMGILLPVAYLFGRATTELVREKGGTLGARRWLVYPAILAVSLPLFLALTLWPLVLIPATKFGLVEPAELYRANVATVHPDGTVVFKFAPELQTRDKAGQVIPYRDEWHARRYGVRLVGSTWKIADDDRRTYEQTLAAMDKMPGPPVVQGAALVAFVTLGGLLGWWLLAGTVMWAFPKWPTTLFHPLLDGYDDVHGLRLAGCSLVGLLIWLGFAARLWETAGRVTV